MYENEIYGEQRDVLEAYLTDYLEPDETFPHGSFDYIVDTKTLSTEDLQAEIAFMEALYTTAVANGIGDGTDITYMVSWCRLQPVELRRLGVVAFE